MSGSIVAGIDLGGTNMQVALVGDRNGIIARHHERTLPEDGREAVIARLVSSLTKVCADVGITTSELSAVGIAAPGAIDTPNGIVLEAPNLQWENVRLRDVFHQAVGCPVVVDNDVNSAAWGEYRLGAGRGHDNFIGVWVGTGVGGGLVLNGQLHHGTLFTAGEIGQTIILPDGEEGFRTVEDYCSRSGMARIIERELPKYPKSVFHSRAKAQGFPSLGLIAQELINAYEAGDPLAQSVIHRAAELLGIAIANWVTVLAPGRVVIGGGVTESLGQPFIDRIRISFERDVFPARSRACELVMTELAGDAGLLGAAMLARDHV
jgi:glucokinase